jgi:copper(I)-binding protein/putative intracellular protease/amidase
MLRRLLLILPLVAVLSLDLPGIFVRLAQASSAGAAEYLCPPCGCGSDGVVFDKPGYCPGCGMELVPKGSVSAPPASRTPAAPLKKAAILLFSYVEDIDFAGPVEVFGGSGIQVFTVATSTSQIRTMMGIKITTDYSLEDAPPADILLIPGGAVFASQQDPRVLKWVQERSKQAQYVMSVCNGAFILAKAGLLDGLTATTTADLIDGLPTAAPNVKAVRDRRYVDNGKFITTAGLSSGIDGALYLVSKLFGQGRAQLVALGIEYDWNTTSNYARANLADRNIKKALGRRLELPVAAGAQATLLSTEGTPQTWEMKWQVAGDSSSANELKLLNDRLVDNQWVEQEPGKSEATERAWRFNDKDGGQWRGVARAQSAGTMLLTVSLKIERTGFDASKKSASAKTGVPAEQMVIRDAWIQEMPPSKKITAAHMVIENLSGWETALVAASTGVAETVELHRAETDNGMMRMRKLDRITLPVGKTDLTGELHIMLIGLKAPLKEGDQVPLILEFENGVEKTVLAPVRKRQTE